MSTVQHPQHTRVAPTPPEIRLLVVGAAFVGLAFVCVAADLRGPAGTVLFLAAVLAGSLGTRIGFAVLTAFTAWGVHTGFVTGHAGVLGLSDGRWQELALFTAAAVLSWAADRARRHGEDR